MKYPIHLCALLALVACAQPVPSGPYLTGKDGWTTTAILTVGDQVADYRMVGLPDGLGAYLDEKSRLVVLMNHELLGTEGARRAHGHRGAFVSRWIIDVATMKAIEGRDLIRSLRVWNDGAYVARARPLRRLCSADLPTRGALFDSATGLGTRERLFMNGEEVPGGGAFAHVVTGLETGTGYELPLFGQAKWENIVASPHPQELTVVIGLDDTHPKPEAEAKPDLNAGKLHVFLGRKRREGTEIEKAGLTAGRTLYVQVGAGGLETRDQPLAGRFALVERGGTNFLRPEDGAWDPDRPGVFYFATTDRPTTERDEDGAGRSRLYRLTFDDIAAPERGGTIEALLTGTEGHEMLDNLTVGGDGHVYLQEDPSESPRLPKIWRFDPERRHNQVIAEHSRDYFARGGRYFLTADGESSGIIEVTHLLAQADPRYADSRRYFLVTQQAHTAPAKDAQVLVERGQLLLLVSPPRK